MFNDLLTRFQELSNLILEEIALKIDGANSSSSAILISISGLFAVTIIVLLGIYTRSYIETRRFLELLTYFKNQNLEGLQHQFNLFRQSLDSSMKVHELLKLFQNKDVLLDDKSAKIDRDKTVNSNKLYIPIYKRAFLMFLLLIVPIIVTTVSQSVLSSNFKTIKPTLLGMIKPKQIIMTAIVTMTQVGTYDTRANSTINDRDISTVLIENIGALSDLVSEEALSAASIEYYVLFHLDYCQFILAENYTSCRNLFNGISTSGVTGMILTLQSFLAMYKNAIDTHRTNRELASEMANAYSMITMANEAIDTIQSQSFAQLVEHLESIETAIIIFIAVSLCLCLTLSGLGIIYVYFPSIKERQNVCKLILLFPASLIIRNSRLKAFLAKDSSEFRKLFQIQH